MENVSILTDFPESEAQQHYKKIAENISGEYTIYTDGNFIYISNTKNKTLRFTASNSKSVEISTDEIVLWLERIQQKYPQF